jgi:hypothetical protein
MPIAMRNTEPSKTGAASSTLFWTTVKPNVCWICPAMGENTDQTTNDIVIAAVDKNSALTGFIAKSPILYVILYYISQSI